MLKNRYLIVSLFTFLILVMLGTQTVVANDEEVDGIDCEQEGEHEGENEGCDNNLVNGGIGLLVLAIIGGIVFYLFAKRSKSRKQQ